MMPTTARLWRGTASHPRPPLPPPAVPRCQTVRSSGPSNEHRSMATPVPFIRYLWHLIRQAIADLGAKSPARATAPRIKKRRSSERLDRRFAGHRTPNSRRRAKNPRLLGSHDSPHDPRCHHANCKCVSPCPTSMARDGIEPPTRGFSVHPYRGGGHFDPVHLDAIWCRSQSAIKSYTECTLPMRCRGQQSFCLRCRAKSHDLPHDLHQMRYRLLAE
jgi:hypothetical protein